MEGKEDSVSWAWRLDSNPALRLGFARYIIPTTLTDGLDILGSVYYPGYDATSTTIGALGRSQQRLTIHSRRAGACERKVVCRYTNLGGPASWYQQNSTPGVNARFNISLSGSCLTHCGGHHVLRERQGPSLHLQLEHDRSAHRVQVQERDAGKRTESFLQQASGRQDARQLRTQQNISVSERFASIRSGDLNERLIGGPGIATSAPDAVPASLSTASTS